jgi:hypothetical protein
MNLSTAKRLFPRDSRRKINPLDEQAFYRVYRVDQFGGIYNRRSIVYVCWRTDYFLPGSYLSF